MSPFRTVGLVARWDAGRRFGFIRTQHAAFFVHIGAVASGEALTPGAVVEFVPEASPRGPRAAWVRRLPPTCPKCDGRLRGLACPACGLQLGT